MPMLQLLGLGILVVYLLGNSGRGWKLEGNTRHNRNRECSQIYEAFHVTLEDRS